ncbi:MAG: hypothetical protein SVR94_18945 [Pseudomonadota bacterium]|nr:hypothetical protein [Pseudomonadota bacterium]
MNTVKIADLTIDELRGLIREEVKQTLLEVLADPDAGLEIHEEVKVRLQRSLQVDAQTISAEEIAKRFGVDW